jgi:hypothetical protein
MTRICVGFTLWSHSSRSDTPFALRCSRFDIIQFVGLSPFDRTSHLISSFVFIFITLIIFMTLIIFIAFFHSSLWFVNFLSICHLIPASCASSPWISNLGQRSERATFIDGWRDGVLLRLQFDIDWLLRGLLAVFSGLRPLF